MKRPIMLLIGFVLASMSMASARMEGWILIYDTNGHALIHTKGGGIRTVARLGDLTVFGNTPNKVAVLTRDKVTRNGRILVVDKQSTKVEASWPTNLYPTSLLSGPSEELILRDDSAYFCSIRFASDEASIDANSLGGTYDLNVVSLATGKIRSIPIPPEIESPHLLARGEAILLFSGERIWRLEEDVNSFSEIDSKAFAFEKLARGERAAAASRAAERGAMANSSKVLPGSAVAFVDAKTGSVRELLKDGQVVELWDIARKYPGAVVSQTRVIDIR